MLNKTICNTCSRIHWDKLPNIGQFDFQKAFNILWSQGHVYCDVCNTYFSFDNEPPNDCPYLLEHVVNKEEISHAQ